MNPDQLAAKHWAAAISGGDEVQAKALLTAAQFTTEGQWDESRSDADIAGLLARHAGLFHGFRHLDFRGREFHPLWVREEILKALKALAGYPQCTLLVSGLRESIALGRKRWTHQQAQRYETARDYIDQLAARFSVTGSTMRILIL